MSSYDVNTGNKNSSFIDLKINPSLSEQVFFRNQRHHKHCYSPVHLLAQTVLLFFFPDAENQKNKNQKKLLLRPSHPKYLVEIF